MWSSGYASVVVQPRRSGPRVSQNKLFRYRPLRSKREFSGLIGAQREKIKNFFGQREKNGHKRAFARHIHVYLSIGSTPPPGRVAWLSKLYKVGLVVLVSTCCAGQWLYPATLITDESSVTTMTHAALVTQK